MVYVGDRPQWVAPFARRERLDAELLRLDAEEHQRLFGSAPLPTFYVIENGVIVDVRDTPNGGATRENRKAALETIIMDLIGEQAAFRGAEGLLHHTPTEGIQR